MYVVYIPKLESARQNLPLINVCGYEVTGKKTTIYYHKGPENLDLINKPDHFKMRSLSLSRAKSAKHLESTILDHWATSLQFIEIDTLEVDSANHTAVKEAHRRVKVAKELIKTLAEWKQCVIHLRGQVKKITDGSFKELRHDSRRADAKEYIKDAVKTCISVYHIKFDEIVDLAEEAVKELQVENIMEG